MNTLQLTNTENNHMSNLFTYQELYDRMALALLAKAFSISIPQAGSNSRS